MAPLETGPRSSLREVQRMLDGVDVSAGLFCNMETAKVAVNGLIKSNDRVIREGANFEVVECGRTTDGLQTAR